MEIPAFLDRLLARPSDGSAPITLGPRRIYILPSTPGLIYGVLLVAMLLGAINYTLALGYALVFLLAGLGLVGMVHTVANLWGLRIQAQEAAPVFVGEWAQFPLELHNPRRSPREDLHLHARPRFPEVACNLAPSAAGRVDVAVQAERRGLMSLPPVVISTRYPLGLFTAWSILRPEAHCLVFPQPIFTPLPHSTGIDEQSGHQGRKGNDDFAGMRERTPADPLKHIAWKAAARSDHLPLQVKQFAGGAREALMLNWEFLPCVEVETRLSTLAGWVLQAEEGGHRYGLLLPNIRLPLDQGLHHRQRCLEALARYPA